MEIIKAECAPKLEPTPFNICYLCLSTDRRTSTVETISYVYGLITDWAPQTDARVCWECRARLNRILKFKVQAVQALQLLETAQSQSSEENYSFSCFSRLKTSPVAIDDTTLESSVISTAYDNLSKENILTESKDLVDIQIPDYGDSEHEDGADSNEQAIDECADIIDKAPAVTASTSATNPPNATAKASKTKLKKKDGKKKKKSEKIAVNMDVNKVPDVLVVKAERFDATKEDLARYRERGICRLKPFPYRCLSCVTGFKVEDKFKEHNETYHSEVAGSSICDVCECRFPMEEALVKHREKHWTLYRCTHPGCGFMHPIKKNITHHYGMHTTKRRSWKETPTGPFQCDICKIILKTNRSLTLHRETHVSKNVYECDHCGHVMNTRLRLICHMYRHMLKVMCDICGKRFISNSSLKMHRLAHLDPSHRPFECEVCHKRFIDKYKLLVHSRQHTGEKPFQCETCSTAYASKEQLTQHVKKHHLPEEESKTKFRKPRTKSFFRNEPIFPGIQHNRIKVERNTPIIREFKSIGNSHKCNICGKILSSLQTLNVHFVVHSNERPFKCDECDKTFKTKAQLYPHKLRHKGEKPYHCTVCGASFSFKNILNAHLQKHSNERAFKCDECDLTFKYNSGLWTHKLIHKGEKHQCTICESKFTQKSALTAHMKTHTNDKPYECDVCKRKFLWRRNLKNHYKTHSKEEKAPDVQ